MTPAEIAANYSKHTDRAALLIEVGRWREALHELNLHLAEFPQSYYGLCESAMCRLELGEYQAAYDLTKDAIAVDPEEERAYRLQSIIFTKNGEGAKSLDAALKCVEKAPDEPAALQTLVQSQSNMGMHDGAAATLALLLKLSPDTSVAHETAGYVALHRGDLKEAEQELLAALAIEPTSVTALNNLGVTYRKMADEGWGRSYRQQSIEMFGRAVKTDPAFETGVTNLKSTKDIPKPVSPQAIYLFVMVLALAPLQAVLYTVFSDRADGHSVAEVLSPMSSNMVILALNLSLSIVFLICLAGLIVIYFKKDRSQIVSRASGLEGWIYLSVYAGILLLIYAAAIVISSVEVSVFTGTAMRLLFMLVLVSVARIVMIRYLRKTDGV